jgi:MPBQ/MSBQ methyltransferase
MKTTTVVSETILQEETPSLSKKEQIINYYEKAGRDYYTWSKKYNMHFGYFERGINPFSRESMLEKLNEQVFQRLNLLPSGHSHVVDLGCGLGASLRYGAHHYPDHHFKGITLVPWQARQAKLLNEQTHTPSTGPIEIIVGDYCKTHLPAQSVDAVFAIESSCYATGSDKSDLLKEIHRILKPGGRFVISDGFIKKQITRNSFIGHAYDQLCRSWALTELGNIHHVQNYLKQLDFADINLEDISMRVAPSVAHVPFTVLSFLINELLFGKESMNKERWDNLKSPLLTMVLGSARSHFGYYFLSGTKR